LQYSHVNYPGIYALEAALDFLDRCGWDRIHGRVAMLSRHLHAALQARGFVVAAPLAALAGIVAFEVPHAEGLAQQLEQRNIKVTGRGARLRVSPHFYNNEEDLERLVEALTQLNYKRA
jgi:selenocysteine lyase/cysteine desulfurase